MSVDIDLTPRLRIHNDAFRTVSGPSAGFQGRIRRAIDEARPGIIPAWKAMAIAVGFPLALALVAASLVVNTGGKVNFPNPVQKAPAHATQKVPADATPGASPSASPQGFGVVPNGTPQSSPLGPSPLGGVGGGQGPGASHGAQSPAPPSASQGPNGCVLDDIDVVTLLPGGTTYRLGTSVPIHSRYHNHGSNNCDLYTDNADACPGPGARVFDNNGTEVWSSKGKCTVATSHGSLGYRSNYYGTLAPGDTIELTFTWNAQVCEPASPNTGCTGPPAPPGSYTTQGYIGAFMTTREAQGGSLRFTLN